MSASVKTAVRREDLELDESASSIAGLKGTILANANSPEGRAAGDRLAAKLGELAVRAPTPHTRDLLQALLDTKELDPFVDSRGVSCRLAVVRAQLALGFPYALEVSPDDLIALRNAAPLTAGPNPKVAGALSLAWNALCAVVLGLVGAGMSANSGVLLLLMSPFVVGAIHAGLALATASKVKRAESPRERAKLAQVYKALAGLGVLGPIFAAVASAALGPTGFVLGVLCAAPAMFTAMMCFFAARNLDAEDQPATR